MTAMQDGNIVPTAYGMTSPAASKSVLWTLPAFPHKAFGVVADDFARLTPGITSNGTF